MKKMSELIIEHLKTKKKYNTLKLNYDILVEDLDKKEVKLKKSKKRLMKQKRENKMLKEQLDNALKMYDKLLQEKK